MDFKVHLFTYICILMHVMDSIEGVNEHAHESRPENVRLLGIEPDLKHDMLVGMDRLKPEDDEASTTYSNSGHRSKSSEEARPKGIYRLIVLPSKLQSIKENEYHTSFPVVKFKYLRTSINEETDIVKSTKEFLRPEGNVLKGGMNSDRNLSPIRRSTSMIGYLGDRSKVEQQLTMATSLVSEEDSMPGSLLDKSYSSQMRRDYLASLLRRIIASKYNHRDQGLVVGGSKSRYSVLGSEKNLDFNKHLQVVPQKKVISLSGTGDISNLEVVPQKKVISLSGIFPRSDDISNFVPRNKQQETPRSFDGILEKVRSKRSLERNPGLLGDVNVSVNKGRTRRASIDLTELLPPIKLEIGRSAPKTDSSESTEDEDENDKRRRATMKMGKTRTRRSIDNNKLSRLLDVTVNKGRSKRASIDLNDLLPPMSLQIGKSASSSASNSAKSRSKRASVDLSGLLPSVDLQVGKSERSIPDSPQNRESIDLSGLLPSVDLQVGKSERSIPDSPQNRESVDLSGLLPSVNLQVGKSERSIPDSPQNRESIDLSGLLPSANLQVGKSERSIPDSRQNPLAPLLRDEPYLHDMLRYVTKKLAKCDDDLTYEDLDLTKQTSKVILDNSLK